MIKCSSDILLLSTYRGLIVLVRRATRYSLFKRRAVFSKLFNHVMSTFEALGPFTNMFFPIQDRAERLFLRYLQKWGKDFLRRRLDWTLDEILGNPAQPRHIQSALCPCQYVEEVVIRKTHLSDGPDCCPKLSGILFRQGLYWCKYRTDLFGYLTNQYSPNGFCYYFIVNLLSICVYFMFHYQSDA